MNFAEQLTHPIIKTIGKLADEMNLETYMVGGFVRDLMLGRPCNDFDFVTIGSGIELATALANHFDNKYHLAVFKNFGTASLKYSPGKKARSAVFNRFKYASLGPLLVFHGALDVNWKKAVYVDGAFSWQ
jgi:tRNA nucleotidyltransferase/poly(A) polymerase